MTEHKKPFVVLEGGSGVGKTSAKNGLETHLGGWRFLREPGGTEFGDMMRDAVQQHPELKIDPLAAFMAYSGARRNIVVYEIMPVLEGLEEAKGVLLDRYWYSSYAYQGSENVDKGTILYVSNLMTGGLMPDLVLHFDLAPELAMMRKSGCGDIDRYDMKELAFHSRVRDSYMELAVKFPDIWKIIDASKPKEEVLADALAALRERGMV